MFAVVAEVPAVAFAWGEDCVQCRAGKAVGMSGDHHLHPHPAPHHHLGLTHPCHPYSHFPGLHPCHHLLVLLQQTVHYFGNRQMKTTVQDMPFLGLYLTPYISRAKSVPLAHT